MTIAGTKRRPRRTANSLRRFHANLASENLGAQLRAASR